MSEAMTNTEIEDVLSSIRRLVAQEARPAQDKLILTPALRVAPVNLAEAPRPQPVAPVPHLAAVPQPEAERESAPQAQADAMPAPTDDTLPQDMAFVEAALAELEFALVAPPQAPSAAPAQTQHRISDEARPVTTAPAIDAGPVEPDETLIDEADLQRLVARLVREELSGQLGEKITLQVRKLVRAEIARALEERGLLG